MKKITKTISLLCMGFLILGNKPAHAQIDSTFNYTGGFQNWTVPCGVSSITITAYGAQGGSANTNANLGGLGAKIVGTFTVTPSQLLTVVVGSQGTNSGTNPGSGGGGGSGVVFGATPLIIAGGGGGRDFGGYDSADAAITNTAHSGSGNVNGGAAGGKGGNVIYSVSNIAYGGNGFNAGNNGDSGTDGVSAVTNITNGSWGLGGGGGGVGHSDCNCGGGGGGYSGGGAGGINGDGGGGGSYNSGTSQANTAGVQSGNGMVVIHYTAPPALTIASSVIANVNCNGNNTGKASATAGGGTGAYTYAWIPSGGTNDTASNLTAGIYTITVTDANGCTITATDTITQPAALSIAKGTIAAWLSSCNGKAYVTVSGGTAPYTYMWSPGGATTDTIKNLCHGTNYCCTVTDKNGCVDSACMSVVTGIPVINNSSSLKIFPNPNNGMFTISGLSKGMEVEVYNYMGEKVGSTVCENETQQFNMSDDANGIYLLRILSKDGVLVEESKLVKSK
jgi:hypothetical protein